MRTLLAWALVLLVAGCADRSERPASTGALASIPAGPDPIVLRVSRSGGLVSALAYPALDSVVWRSSFRLPPLARVLGFNPDDGYLSAVDTVGRPVRLDLRLGAVAIPGAEGAVMHASADGAVMYAVNADGDVARYTPVGDRWTFRPRVAPAALIPLLDGSLVIAEAVADGVTLRRVRPPDTTVVDSLHIVGDTVAGSVHGVTIGDRVFLSTGSRVIALRTRDFVQDVDVDVGASVRSLVTSPSGDRVFVLVRDEREVRVIDRFEGRVVSKVVLPGNPTELRMDPLGRVLIVRGEGNVAWIVDVGTAEVVGEVKTEWRGDLPLVLPDGAVALVAGDTVSFTSTIDLGVVRTIPDGARDSWFAMRWNGFRPRAKGLDEPVRFRASSGSLAGSGEVAGTLVDNGSDSARASDTAGRVPNSLPIAADDRREDAARVRSVVFTVQFAAVLTEELAREAAAGISVDGRVPRIATTVRDDRTLFRVVLGPYPTREDADRIGKASGRSYWVFEGAP